MKETRENFDNEDETFFQDFKKKQLVSVCIRTILSSSRRYIFFPKKHTLHYTSFG